MRRWSELSQVDRVDVYTRQSLYLLLWLFVGVVLLSGLSADPPGQPTMTLLVGGVTVLTASGSVALHDVMDLHPLRGPLPWRSIAPLLALVTIVSGLAFAQPRPVRIALLTATAVCLSWALGGILRAWVAPAVILAPSVLLGLGASTLRAAGAAVLMTGFVVFTVRVSLWLVGVVREIDQARATQAALAVAEERLRFSRDVHDVMGRRLSTIAVQSELAATLAERGADGAGEQMLAVRGLAHEALREARELARGYRPVSLEQEMEGARSLLRSAGISVDVDVDSSKVPAASQEHAAWVVREGVTNVLRHSTASRVQIGFAAGTLTIVNDGAATTGQPPGSGLSGLRERLAPHGARLGVQTDNGSFTLIAQFPDNEDVPT